MANGGGAGGGQLVGGRLLRRARQLLPPLRRLLLRPRVVVGLAVRVVGSEHPGPPQRFEPNGAHDTYQHVLADRWPRWGGGGDLNIGSKSAPGGEDSYCHQGTTYRGTDGEICGGDENWGPTDVEVWYPR